MMSSLLIEQHGWQHAGGRAAAGMGLYEACRKLDFHHATVQSILLDADAKSRTSPAIRCWMSYLKMAAYHAEDVLDEF